MKWRPTYLCIAFTLMLSGCQRELNFADNGLTDGITYRLLLEHTAGTQPLQLNVANTNTLNETYTVSTLRYYISGIELRGDQASGDKEYHLIDLSSPATATIFSKAAKGNYRSIRFLLGVDSIRNVSGAQTGALDPANGMFWTWNTGYIMWKLEGSSPQSTEPNQRITYHIGGFAPPYATQKECVLPLPENIRLETNNTVEIRIRCDVNGFFQKRHQLPIAANAVCTAPGQLAAQYADNYQNIFQVTSVRQ